MENLLNASYALLQSLHIVKATPPPVTDTPALETTIVPATTPAHYLRAGLNDQEQKAQVVPARIHDQRVDGASLSLVNEQTVEQKQRQEQKQEQNVDPSGRNGKQPGHEGRHTNSDFFDSQGAPFSNASSMRPTYHTSASWVNSAPGRLGEYKKPKRRSNFEEAISESESELDVDWGYNTHPKSDRPFIKNDRYRPGKNRPVTHPSAPHMPSLNSESVSPAAQGQISVAHAQHISYLENQVRQMQQLHEEQAKAFCK